MSFQCTGTPVCLPIYTTVVYDYCYQDEEFDVVSSVACATGVPSGLTCSVAVTCALDSVATAATPGYVLSNWTYSGTVTLTWNCDGIPTSTTLPFHFFKMGVLLCSPPPGTNLVCEASAAQVPFIDFANNRVGAHIAVCLQFESLKEVKLLVQTYGEVVPSQCETGGLLPCPPGPMPLPCDP